MKILKYSIIITAMFFLCCSVSFAGSASGGGISNTGADSRRPAVAINVLSNPVIVWDDNNAWEVYIRQWNGTSWEEMGAGSASGGGLSNNSDLSSHPAIAINNTGNPIAVWDNVDSGLWHNIYVLQWNGTIWEEMGTDSATGTGITSGSSNAENPAVVLNDSGHPVIVWDQNIGNRPEIYVKQWNGTSWEPFGSSASGGGISNTAEFSDRPALMINGSGMPVVTWNDITGGDWDVYVRQWNGSSWEELGGSATGGGISNGNSAGIRLNPSIIKNGSGHPVVGWGDYSSGEIYIKQWNGSSWEELGAGSASGGGMSNTPGDSENPAMATDESGNPIVCWMERILGKYEIYLKQWNGSSWEELGGSATGGGISNNTGDSENPAVTMNSSDYPVVTWDDDTAGNKEIYVRRWNGSYWEELEETILGSIVGKVTETDDITPIQGALVEVLRNDSVIDSAITTINGDYSVLLTSGICNMFISSNGYIGKYVNNVNIVSGQSTNIDVSLYAGSNFPPNAPQNPLCNNQSNPINVTASTPDFSWVFSDNDVGDTQSAYRLLVSSSSASLSVNIGDMWDSYQVSSDSYTIYTGSTLSEDTTYYWKVMTWDNWNFSGSYCNIQSFYFPYNPSFYPNQVNDLSVIPTIDCKIQLNWINSTSPGVERYNIYYATSTVDINYSVIMDSVAYPTETWTSPTLVDGVTYKFVVRAENDEGYEEKNTNIVSATAVNEINNLPKAVIWIPQTGKKISGNRVTIMARILDETDIPDVKEVRFQYKTVTDTVWGNIPPSQHGNTENPDNLYPYFMHWDVIGLAERAYNIRAIAYNRAGEPDPNPGFITIAVDYANPDIIENYTDGIVMRTESIDNNRDNTVRMGGEETGGGITEVLIPQGALDTVGNVSLSITDNPADMPEIPSNRIGVGRVKDIKLGNGVNLIGIATIKIPYNDANNDGIEDDSGVNENNLMAYTSPDSNSTWEEIAEGNYTIYPSSNIIAINTNHFSLYSIMAESTEDLNVLTYPNPFGEGGTSFIYTLGSESNVTIKIYTLSGRLINNLIEDTKTSSYHDEDFWDGKDEGSKQLANGVYIYKLTATPTSGENSVTKTGKLVIMR